MARSKHPFQKSVFHKDDVIQNNPRTRMNGKKKPLPDSSTIETDLSHKTIFCKICKVREKIELEFEYQDYTRTGKSHTGLTEIVNNFKIKHLHPAKTA